MKMAITQICRQDKYYGEGWNSMLSFPQFMLQVLYDYFARGAPVIRG